MSRLIYHLIIIHWLIYWLIIWLSWWLIDLLIELFFDWFTDWLINCLIFLIDWLIFLIDQLNFLRQTSYILTSDSLIDVIIYLSISRDLVAVWLLTLHLWTDVERRSHHCCSLVKGADELSVNINSSHYNTCLVESPSN